MVAFECFFFMQANQVAAGMRQVTMAQLLKDIRVKERPRVMGSDYDTSAEDMHREYVIEAGFFTEGMNSNDEPREVMTFDDIESAFRGPFLQKLFASLKYAVT